MTSVFAILPSFKFNIELIRHDFPTPDGPTNKMFKCFTSNSLIFFDNFSIELSILELNKFSSFSIFKIFSIYSFRYEM